MIKAAFSFNRPAKNSESAFCLCWRAALLVMRAIRKSGGMETVRGWGSSHMEVRSRENRPAGCHAFAAGDAVACGRSAAGRESMAPNGPSPFTPKISAGTPEPPGAGFFVAKRRCGLGYTLPTIARGWCRSLSSIPHTEAVMSKPDAPAGKPLAEPSGADRRAAIRYSSSEEYLSLENSCRPLTAPRNETWQAWVRDFSTGGIGLAVTRRFEPGTLLTVELQDMSQQQTRLGAGPRRPGEASGRRRLAAGLLLHPQAQRGRPAGAAVTGGIVG